MNRRFHSFHVQNKRIVIVFSVAYIALLAFMIKMIGIGATVAIFLFLAICSLPALLARVLGEKSHIAEDGNTGGYRFIYSYRYGSKFGDHKR